jgi:hypothetical protein
VNYILFEENIFNKGLKVLLLLIILLISVLNYSSVISSSGTGVENNPLLNIQAVNNFTETTTTKANCRLLTESFSGNIFSYEYGIKKLVNRSKILIIISQAVSEVNHRYSAFLITELTTST